MKRGDFFEDDEPIEDILAVLAAPAAGVTGKPISAGATVHIGIGSKGPAIMRPAVASADSSRHAAVVCR